MLYSQGNKLSRVVQKILSIYGCLPQVTSLRIKSTWFDSTLQQYDSHSSHRTVCKKEQNELAVQFCRDSQETFGKKHAILILPRKHGQRCTLWNVFKCPPLNRHLWLAFILPVDTHLLQHKGLRAIRAEASDEHHEWSSDQHRHFAFTFLFIWKVGMQVHERAEKCAIKQAAYTRHSHVNSKHFREFILEAFSQHETREC